MRSVFEIQDALNILQKQFEQQQNLYSHYQPGSPDSINAMNLMQIIQAKMDAILFVQGDIESNTLQYHRWIRK